MKTSFIFLLSVLSVCVQAQPNGGIKAFIIQNKDTINIEEGLINYNPIRFAWIKNPAKKINAIEVTFGNGAFAYSTNKFKVPKDQNWITIDLKDFRTQEAADSIRMNKDRYSRIVIIPMAGPNSYYSEVWTVPFKIRKPLKK